LGRFESFWDFLYLFWAILGRFGLFQGTLGRRGPFLYIMSQFQAVLDRFWSSLGYLVLFWNVSCHSGLVQSVSGYLRPFELGLSSYFRLNRTVSGPFWTVLDCFGLFQASLGLFWAILVHFLLIGS
jgi:hypothetical protein